MLGQWFYLYLILDLYSRKIVGWEVHATDDADHGTHEQFHSEFKTDLDLTRLPSGKFDTNYLVCQLAALTMNILRLIGQAGLTGPDAPVRHPAKRRRLKTVLQELIYRAGRLIEHGRPPNSCAGTQPPTPPQRHPLRQSRRAP